MKRDEPEHQRIQAGRARNLGLTLEELEARDRELPPSQRATEWLAYRRDISPEELLREAMEHMQDSPYPTPECPLPMDLVSWTRGELTGWPEMRAHLERCEFCLRIYQAELSWSGKKKTGPPAEAKDPDL